jgi:membrane peptidoglycan carboxypeptidase
MGCGSEAGKTGTSEDLSDAWFVGYTPLYSTAVWVGHPQSREATGFGGPTAGPIWRSFMEAAVAGDCPEFPEPSTLPELSGLDSGHTSGSYSSSGESEYNEYEEEESSEESSKEGKEAKEEGGGAAPEGEAEPAPEAAPEPTPAPSSPPPSGGGISPG